MGVGLATALIIGGTGLAVAGQIQQAQAAKAEAKNAKMIAQQRAEVAKADADAAARREEAKGEQLRRKQLEMDASANVLVGKAGVTGRGSPLTVAAQRAKDFEMDLAQLRTNANELRLKGQRQAGVEITTGSVLASNAQNRQRGYELGAIGAGFKGGSTILTSLSA